MSAPVVLPSFLSPEECEAQISAAEAIGFAEAPVTTANGPMMWKELRNNTRVMVDSTAIADALWFRLRPFAPQMPGWTPVGLNERFRYYRYDPGEYFAPHTDGFFARSSQERSFFTVLLYLNEGYEGGETIVAGKTFVPQAGMCLLFLHHLRHESVSLRVGRKYVLRTDLMYRRS